MKQLLLVLNLGYSKVGDAPDTTDSSSESPTHELLDYLLASYTE